MATTCLHGVFQIQVATVAENLCKPIEELWSDLLCGICLLKYYELHMSFGIEDENHNKTKVILIQQ